MNAKYLELALKKQRLQFEAQLQRQDLARDLAGLAPLFHAVDHVRDGVGWMRRNGRVLAAGALAVAVLKPRIALRIARRAWFGVTLYRRSSATLAPLLAQLRALRETAGTRF